MAKSKFSASSFLFRLLFAVSLVFATFNPVQPYSYYYWALKPLITNVNEFSILKGLIGIILLIGWTIFLRATLRSLGLFGTVLAVGFFGLLLWWLVDAGWIGVQGEDTVSWMILTGLSGVLAAGLSWSHIRRRLTGQIDVDETDT